MTITVRIPGLAASALALAAAEDALAIGTKRIGALAQISGAGAAGFTLFTPTANATYYLVIRGQDAATGAPTNAFVDVVELAAVGAAWAPTAVGTQNTFGAPGVRTYANATGALKITIALGGTYYIDIVVVRFPV